MDLRVCSRALQSSRVWPLASTEQCSGDFSGSFMGSDENKARALLKQLFTLLFKNNKMWLRLLGAGVCWAAWGQLLEAGGVRAGFSAACWGCREEGVGLI